MSPRAKLRVGVVGLGFMGRTHIAAWRAADAAGWPNALTAVCDRADVLAAGGRPDPEPSKNAGSESSLFDRATVKTFERAVDLFASAEVDVASVCTPTPTHVDLAIAALEAGKHVLLEKPVALRAQDAERLAAAAEKARTLCMPAMCVRFWPGWSWLRERIAAGTFGAVKSAVFRRLGTRPTWSGGFYEDYARSGGALVDLHVHDADFVRWCFGHPAAVATSGTLDHATTAYAFPRGPAHVLAEGGWDHARGFPFTMRYTVVFEGATADFDLNRKPALSLARGGGVEGVALESLNGYDGEVRHLMDAIAGRAELAATCREAALLTRMLEAERQSLESRIPVVT